jgi:hypothetical protein
MSDIPLRDFRDTVAKLSSEEQAFIVRQALRLLQSLYVHTLDGSTNYFSAAITRLEQLELQCIDGGTTERMFHSRVINAFKLLRDRHTLYLLPNAFRGRVAVLPFVLTEYFADAGRRYCVSLIEPTKVSDSAFTVGVDVTHWNGIPLNTVIQSIAEREDGAHAPARSARALEALTVRPLWLLPMPEEDCITITYSGETGTRLVNFDWYVSASELRAEDQKSADSQNLLTATDVKSEAISQFIDTFFLTSRQRAAVLANEVLETKSVSYCDFRTFLRMTISSFLILRIILINAQPMV